MGAEWRETVELIHSFICWRWHLDCARERIQVVIDHCQATRAGLAFPNEGKGELASEIIKIIAGESPRA